jgi:putative cell wall-binding protein
VPFFSGYTDLIGFDIHPDPTLVGDTFAAQAFSSMGPFPFYNDEFSTVGVTDDGFLVMPGGYGGEPWFNQSIPDVALPNGVIAGLWADMEIAYADESSLGAGDEMGITLASLGGPGAGAVVFEYDDPFEWTADDTIGPSVTDMQIWVWNFIDPDFPEIEIYYDNVGTLPAAATIGVEDFGGENAFAVVNNADPAATVAAADATTGLCLDYEPAVFPPVTVSYTVEANGLAVGTATNTADHITDDPYAQVATASADVALWKADFSWKPVSPAPDQPVTFDATASFTPLAGLLSSIDDLTFSWDFDGDGVEDATGPKPTTTFDSVGLHDVELTVTSDDLDSMDSHVRTVTVVEDLPPTADAGADKVAAVNAPVTLNGTGSDPNGGPVTYSWDPGDGSGTLAGKTVEHTYTQAGKYTATLTVTDQGGLTATDTVEITVVPGDAVDAVYRAFGSGREQTAIELSKAGWASADTVILAYSGDYPDALAAATLGAAVNAPVLQNGTDALADHNKTEIERLGAEKVYVVSGPNAISEAVVDALEAMGLEVERLSGATRFHTAAAIADEIVELNGKQDQVVVALGTFWADALSSGTLATTTGSPVLLANEDSVPAETIAAIKRVLTAGGKVWMVGGPATMDPAVETQLFNEGFDVSRLAGADRFATNVVVLNEAVSQGANLGIAVVASGGNYPDALSAAVAAWKLGGFLILVHPDDLSLSPPSAGFLVDHADDIHGALIAGGPNTIADAVVTQVANAIE